MAAQRVDRRGTRAHTRGPTAFLRIPQEDWGRGLAKEVAGGIPKEGRKKEENYTGFKSGREDERLESLAWLWVTKSPMPCGMGGESLPPHRHPTQRYPNFA